jgi:hypothetical protein
MNEVRLAEMQAAIEERDRRAAREADQENTENDEITTASLRFYLGNDDDVHEEAKDEEGDDEDEYNFAEAKED